MTWWFNKPKSSRWMMFWLTVLFLLPVVTGAAEPEPLKVVTVMGKSLIYSDNVAAARSQAISNGLDSAVSLVMVSELTPDKLFMHFQKINEILQNRTDKFVQDYKVLTETRAGRVYRVLVQATVSISVLGEQLAGAGIVLGKKNLPKVLFFLAEQKMEDIAPRYWWGQQEAFYENFAGTALVDVFKEKGFTIIDPLVGIQGFEWGDEYQKPDLTDQEAMNIAFRMQAEVIVIGRASTQPTANTMGTNLRSFKGIVTARAIRMDTGQMVASVDQSAVTVHTDEFQGGRDALSTAGFVSGEQLAAQISADWLKESNQPTLVTLVVKGRDLKNFEMFRGTLDKVSGVNEIQIIEMKTDEITMTVDFQGNAEVLASALMLKTFDTFGLSIYDILPDNLKIELVPR